MGILRFSSVHLLIAGLVISGVVSKASETLVTAQEFSQALSANMTRVEEFRFIRQKADGMGVKAYLFGGTAAGFAHYVKWDLQRQKGDLRFLPDRFDYHYMEIYRSNQDLDIVIDGSPEQAWEFQKSLQSIFPHVQGAKPAWEVRLLRSKLGDKQALLGDPDFHNQHTDSNSTGLIEITSPQNGDWIVRDLRQWDEPDNHFLEDVLKGKLHYYFSAEHNATSRFKNGLNPPILSVIRYLTKAFQYELEIAPEDWTLLKKVIDEFHPAQGLSSYVFSWIERNGAKLFQNAVNVEYAWKTLNALGLRKKLVKMGNADSVGSMAWWLNKEPLQSFPVGSGGGRTAHELGIEIVGHETRNFEAYESITRAHTGEPNVFISRDDFSGETAALGNGFYTRIGHQGAVGRGFTIRFKVDPRARLGTDFKLDGDYVIIKNKEIIRVIPESLHFSLVEYFEAMTNGLKFSQSDLGVIAKLRRRIKTQFTSVTDDEFNKIQEIMAKQEIGPRGENIDLFADWGILKLNYMASRGMIKTPQDYRDIVKKIFQGSPVSQYTFARPLSETLSVFLSVNPTTDEIKGLQEEYKWRYFQKLQDALLLRAHSINEVRDIVKYSSINSALFRDHMKFFLSLEGSFDDFFHLCHRFSDVRVTDEYFMGLLRKQKTFTQLHDLAVAAGSYTFWQNGVKISKLTNFTQALADFKYVPDWSVPQELIKKKLSVFPDGFIIKFLRRTLRSMGSASEVLILKKSATDESGGLKPAFSAVFRDHLDLFLKMDPTPQQIGHYSLGFSSQETIEVFRKSLPSLKDKDSFRAFMLARTNGLESVENNISLIELASSSHLLGINPVDEINALLRRLATSRHQDELFRLICSLNTKYMGLSPSPGQLQELLAILVRLGAPYKGLNRPYQEAVYKIFESARNPDEFLELIDTLRSDKNFWSRYNTWFSESIVTEEFTSFQNLKPSFRQIALYLKNAPIRGSARRKFFEKVIQQYHDSAELLDLLHEAAGAHPVLNMVIFMAQRRLRNECAVGLRGLR